MSSGNFIYTPNMSTAKELIQRGYQLFEKNDGRWTFINNKKLTFSDLDSVFLTNRLFL